ncbi:homeobox protein HOX1A-like isoform X3 [Zingiber officinale]|uniref:homeobox protein HOX1A-like isoform X3 n=1 Tax=Zingiber officinale TaxID=94328 RepID=UPI001C4CEA47|nr:homeobox protein HOX1A-like isoform X3 [Zingiber officinale]
MDKDPNSETAANDYRDAELPGREHTGIENNLQHRKHNSNKSVRKRGKLLQNGRARYSLRSSLRVLRSMSKCKVKISSEPSNSAVSPVTKKRKKKRKGKSAPSNEFSQRRKHISYLLRKINFEQSLIDAYVNEGWKGLSLEKIRPEKELERAKSEILQCKLRIRDAFQQLDSLLSIGRLEENLFDDNGEIDSEDMFCAKCGSKDISADNDIILCDGICDRAFHQKCLSPPLATNEIPPEDQGWLCPACDCKVDCLDLFNDSQGTDFSIEDTWEKIFPEATAVANGNNQFDDSIYPSEDSEDYDYQPDHVEGNAEDQEERSSSDESDSASLSEDLGQPVQNKIDYLGLPSDDSEDDDYDPDQPEPDKDKDSDLNESDFMSDSDDFCADLCKTVNANAVSSNLCDSEPLDGSGQLRATMQFPLNAENPLVEVDAGQGTNYPTSKKRQRESSDFKKLHDISNSRRASNVSNVYGTTGKTSGKETIHSSTTPDQDNSVTSVRNKKSSKRKIENTPGQRKTLTSSNRKNTGSKTSATLDQPKSTGCNTSATLDQPNSLIRTSGKNVKSSKANADTPATLDQLNSLIRSSRTNAKSSKANANTVATLDQPNCLIRSSRKNAKQMLITPRHS